MPPASSTTARKLLEIPQAVARRADPFRRNWREVRKGTQKALKPSRPRSKGNHLSGPRSTADHRMPHRATKDPS